MTDLYTTILKSGGQILQDGSAWKDFASKDGGKIIRQIAQKNGTGRISAYNISCQKTHEILHYRTSHN